MIGTVSLFLFKLRTQWSPSLTRVVTCVWSWKARITCVSPGRSRVPFHPKQLSMISVFGSALSFAKYYTLNTSSPHRSDFSAQRVMFSACSDAKTVKQTRWWHFHNRKQKIVLGRPWNECFTLIAIYDRSFTLISKRYYILASLIRIRFKTSLEQTNQKGYVFLPFALALTRHKASREIHWCQSPGIKSSPDQMDNKCFTSVPVLCSVASFQIIFWMDSFFIRYFPPLSILPSGTLIVTMCCLMVTTCSHLFLFFYFL